MHDTTVNQQNEERLPSDFKPLESNVRLALRKETLRNLGERELQYIVGGQCDAMRTSEP